MPLKCWYLHVRLQRVTNHNTIWQSIPVYTLQLQNQLFIGLWLVPIISDYFLFLRYFNMWLCNITEQYVPAIRQLIPISWITLSQPNAPLGHHLFSNSWLTWYVINVLQDNVPWANGNYCQDKHVQHHYKFDRQGQSVSIYQQGVMPHTTVTSTQFGPTHQHDFVLPHVLISGLYSIFSDSCIYYTK
jgi:hypothetical protein